MDVYEKSLSDEINKLAGKQVFFYVEQIVGLDQKTSKEIVGCLLSWACQSQNDRPITLGRQYLTMLPKEWVIDRIKEVATSVLDLNDDWEYRRFLELSEMISIDLLRWSHEKGMGSDNPDVLEAYNDFLEHI